MSLLNILKLPPPQAPRSEVAAPAGAGSAPGLMEQIQRSATDTLNDGITSARDKLLGGLGAAKGVVTQATEVLDTAGWVGTEYQKLRREARDAVIGPKGTVRADIAEALLGPDGSPLPQIDMLKNFADGAEATRQAGGSDLTTALSEKLNQAGRWVESKLGTSGQAGELLTPMERGEIAGSISAQVMLATVGAEEIKVAMAFSGAAAGLKTTIETVRADPKGWHRNTAVWSGLIGMALSILGLKNTMAADKLTTAILKSGWLVAAIPPITQMALDATDKTLAPDERERRFKKHLAEALNILKDAVLHVVDARAAKAAEAAEADGSRPARPAQPEPAAEPHAKPPARPEPPASAVLPTEEPHAAAPGAPKAAPHGAEVPETKGTPAGEAAPAKAKGKPAPPATPEALGRVKGMRAVLDRLDAKGITFDQLGISHERFLKMMAADPAGAVADFNRRIDVYEIHAEQQRSAEPTAKKDTPGRRVKPQPKPGRAGAVGKNPPKDSPVGRQVIARMRGEGKIRGPAGAEEVFHAPTKKWYPIAECDMGHTVDAVRWWNEEGKFYGAKSEIVRRWMNRPDIYELEPGGTNSSRGAQIGEQYEHPHDDPITPSELGGTVKPREDGNLEHEDE